MSAKISLVPGRKVYYNKKTENKEKGGTSLCRRMEQHLGIGILMQDIAETFEE